MADLTPAWNEHERVARSVPQVMRSTLGAFFTPREVAVRTATEVLQRFPHGTVPKILDPACGAGALLLGCLEYAARERPDWVAPLLGGKIHGWEIERGIAEGARHVLTAAGKCLGVRVASLISCRDGLLADERELYDVVIANPPWKSFSGRQAQEIDPMLRALYAKKFGAFAGWPATHTAFAEQSARLIKREGGRLGLLLPYQIADLEGYAPLRRALAALVSVDRIIDLGENTFPGVTEPCGLFVLKAGKGDISGEPWNAQSDVGITMRAGMRHQPLPPESFGDIGVHTGNAAELLIIDKPEQGALAIREGKDVRPFAIDPPRLWLRPPKMKGTGHYARMASPERYAKTPILLRQTANRPIACRHQPAALFRNSVLACFGAPDHDIDYLIGVLNSEYVARLYRNSFRDARQRAFPQIKIEALRTIPIPSRRAAQAVYEQIVKISQALQAKKGADPALLNQLEAAVVRAYVGS